MLKIFLIALAVTLTISNAAIAEETSVTGDSAGIGMLTLDAAIEKALNAAPKAAGAEARLRAAAGAVEQASALPNPELSTEFENFAGSRAYRGTTTSEGTVSVSQLIELGGKRAARTGIAEAERTATEFDRQVTWLEIIREVKKAYSDALAADEEVALAKRREDLAREVVRSVGIRVEAGREPAVQRQRAETLRRQAAVEVRNSQRRATAARSRLASLLGSGIGAIRLDVDWFSQLPLSASDAAPVDAPNTPDLRKLEAEVQRARADFQLELSRAVPDLTVSAGVRRFQATDDTALVAGVSIPLPIANQNRGAISRARESATAAEAELRAARIENATLLTEARARLEQAKESASTLQNDVLPATEGAFRSFSEGYRQGRFSFLEVLEVQREFFDARRELIEALQGFHEAQADVDRLMGADKSVQER